MAEVAVDFLLGPDWSSRIIAWYGTGYGGYSHAANVLADGRYLDARSDVIAGVPSGVHIRHALSERSVKRTRASLTVTDQDYAAWEANLRAKIGDPYATIDIWGFITGREVTVNGVYDCSQLAVNALQHIGVFPKTLPLMAHSISPMVLLMMMAGRGARITTLQAAGGELLLACDPSLHDGSA